MDKKPVFKWIVLPAAIVLGLMIVSIHLFNISRWWEPQWLHNIFALLSAAGMFLSIWLGAMIANNIAFFNGAAFTLATKATCSASTGSTTSAMRMRNRSGYRSSSGTRGL